VERKQEIEEQIKDILIRQLQVDPQMVAESTPTTSLFGRGIGLDSIEALALAAELEAKFDIQINDEDLTVELFKNIESLAEHVLRNK
jgi:acyl carrier protein